MPEFETYRNEFHKAVEIVLQSVSAKSLLAKHKTLITEHPALADVLSRLQNAQSKLNLIAIGKMAQSLAYEFTSQLGIASVCGLVTSPYDSAAPVVSGLDYFLGGHPVPNDQSLASAQAALNLVRGLQHDDPVVYLISGGGSACLELPRDPLELQDVRQIYEVLVKCGASIQEINRVRRRLSLVKGGKLAAACRSRRQLALIVSDVIGDDLQFVSSGPTCFQPDIKSSTGLMAIVEKYGLSNEMPEAALKILAEADSDAHIQNECDSICIGSNDVAVAAAEQFFSGQGWQTRTDRRFDEVSVAEAARGLVQSLSELTPSDGPCCIVAGGEVTSKVVGTGQGGRNQAFVLECVPLIRDQNIVVMSFGTDGIDGNSVAAGAIADGNTFTRAEKAGMSYEQYAADSNSFEFFSRLNDTLEPGPTQTNVCDVRVLLKF